MINKINVYQTNNFAKTDEDKKRLKEACEEFESIFLYYLIKQMRETIPKLDEEWGVFGGSKQEEIFREMLDEEIAKEMAKAGGIGLIRETKLYEEVSKIGLKESRKNIFDIKQDNLEKFYNNKLSLP